MSKGKQWTPPKRIETNQGETVVKIVPSDKATKIHKCVLCETPTEFYEEHLLLLPVAFYNNRRYAHTKCLEEWLRCGLEIKLHHSGFSAFNPYT